MENKYHEFFEAIVSACQPIIIYSLHAMLWCGFPRVTIEAMHVLWYVTIN